MRIAQNTFKLSTKQKETSESELDCQTLKMTSSMGKSSARRPLESLRGLIKEQAELDSSKELSGVHQSNETLKDGLESSTEHFGETKMSKEASRRTLACSIKVSRQATSQ